MAPATIQYRRMTNADVPAVHALEEICFSSPWDIEAYYGEMQNPTAVYVVAESGDDLLGFGGMWTVADEAHIVTLATKPEARRQGLGRRMMELLMEEARHRRIAIISLEVRISNIPAQRLYESFGFYTVAHRARYYPDNNEDAAIMVLRLTRE